MFNLIKSEVKSMVKTVNNMISSKNEVKLAKIKLTEECIKGLIKNPNARKVAGVVVVSVGVGLGGGLIVSSYV